MCCSRSWPPRQPVASGLELSLARFWRAADALIGSADASGAELERLLEAGGSEARQNLAGAEQRDQAAAVLAFRERLVDPFPGLLH